jgi:ribosomal protein S18 acetylase RimI-like enzyme
MPMEPEESAIRMQIREARESDVDDIARLHAESWRTAYRGALSDAYLDGPIEAERSALWRGRLEQPAGNQFVVVAESAGKMVGFACAYGGEDQKWGTFLDNLHVTPDRKRRGIGAQLMGAVAAWSARIYPGQGIYLWVLQSNFAAQRFYQRLGGENAGTDLWTPPDGSALPKLRFAWRHAEALSAGVANLSLHTTAGNSAGSARAT